MDKSLMKEIKNLAHEFLRATQRVFSKPGYFAGAMQDNPATFRRACTFLAVVSLLLTAINIISYKINHIPLDWSFISFESGVTCLIFMIFSSGVWAFSKALGGKGTVTKTLCTCFYASVVLVPVKVLELPTRVIRDGILLQGPISDITIDRTRAAINATAFKFEFIVLIGIIAFLWLMTNMLKKVHAFGRVRQFFLFVFSFYLLTMMTNSFQEPITQLILRAFS